MVEALLFASSAPLTVAQIQGRLPHGCDAAAALDVLERDYADRGVRLRCVGGAWAFRTASDLGHVLTHEVTETRTLSRAAVETLAIVAYHQPVTRAEIEEIRGVSVSKGTVEQLMELDWIRLGRRRDTPGRPVTFVVTAGFMDHFGLTSLRDLPGLKELRAAGLLDATPARGRRPGSGRPVRRGSRRGARPRDARRLSGAHEEPFQGQQQRDAREGPAQPRELRADPPSRRGPGRSRGSRSPRPVR